MKLSARARVQVTVELLLSDTWGDDCTTAQVMKQARDGVEQMLMRGLAIVTPGLRGAMTLPDGSSKTPATIVGEPKVTMVLVEENR